LFLQGSLVTVFRWGGKFAYLICRIYPGFFVSVHAKVKLFTFFETQCIFLCDSLSLSAQLFYFMQFHYH